MIKSKFILNILELLLDGDEDGVNANSQIGYLTESNFDYTGVGVFIEFKQTEGIEKYRSNIESLVLNGVVIKSSELEIGADCTLFFKDGLISYLEIWSYSGNYPKKELIDYELTQQWKGSPKRKVKSK